MWDLCKQWMLNPSSAVAIQLPRALVVSVAALALDFGTLILLVECGRMPHLPAAVVSYLLGGVLQYVLCSVWVFSQAHASRMAGFLVFTLLSLVGLAITVGVMQAAAFAPYPVAKGAAVGLAFSWNFLSRKWLFELPWLAPVLQRAM